MQININQSQEVADNTTTKLSENKARQEAQRNILEKNHQTYPKKKEKKKLAKAGETKENLQYLITTRRKPNRRSRRHHKAQTISKTPLLSSSAPKTRHTTPVVAKKHRAVDATANLCTSS
jgi:hypothetical protein